MSKSLNPWNYKPWWCQPWSILLTGVLIVGGSWLMFQTIWVTVLVAMPILVWWIYFLILWPKFVRSQILLTSLEPSQDSPNFNR
ncbi:DUF6737 family protein [Gloeothece citriformis]|uniref:DUF6737 family protein n=1 Tax=Gloeothece citriformis TaxID=2546356 RepID=UPI0002EE0A24|nr:DUF6737 family protein [Gloeothece citriformis]